MLTYNFIMQINAVKSCYGATKVLDIWNEKIYIIIPSQFS